MRTRRTVAAALSTAAAVTFVVVLPATAGATASIGGFTTKGAWSFVSAPRVHPPRLQTRSHVARGKLAPGSFLLTNFPNLAVKGPMTGQGGPLIVDSRLSPVWFHSVGTSTVSGDLQQETLDGKPVLVWWQGVITNTGATSSGEVEIVDQHYRTVAALRAQGPVGCTGVACWKISIHDAVISGDDIWVTVYRNVPNQNLAPYGGSSHATVYDAGVQEYSLSTPSKPVLMRTWDALNPGGTPNVPLSASEQPASTKGTGPGGSWDAYHVNAVQVLPNDQLLVSMRNTWAVYLVEASTGRTSWTLGGKGSSFRMPAGARFAWQHDARLLPNDELTLFDDNCCKQLGSGSFAKPNGPSRGLVLKLDTTRHTASLVASYTHSPSLSVAFLGSTQLLPGGNALVGWGSLPFFSEYSNSGRQLLDAVFPGKDRSYRVLFTSTWMGTPSYPPSGVVRASGGRTTVYASWNGATEVARWIVLGGASASRLKPVASEVRTGFETEISLGRRSYKALAVRAVDALGRPLGTRLI
jgi:hypothetical protein